MNLPNIPTDNLYKFQCVTGLVLVIVTTIFSIFSIGQIRLKTAEVEIDAKIIKARQQQLKSDIDEASQILNLTQQMEENIIKDEVMIDTYKKQTEDLKFLFQFGFITGALLYIPGYLFWYLNLQRYKDFLFKEEGFEFKKDPTF